MKIYVQFIIICFFCFFSLDGFATHNRAGEIIVEQLEPCNEYSIKATIITYTKASSTPADRDSLIICWGAGDVCETVYRSNGPNFEGEVLENDIKRNEYIGFFSYPSSGTYTISMTDPNRNGGVLNVNYPASDQVQFHIQTTHTLLDCQFYGVNNSPILDYEPVDVGCVGEIFRHNPGAYDPDGDSLSYEIIVPFADVNTQVPNYAFPNDIGGIGSGTFAMNAVTGTLTWNAPTTVGEYNFAFMVISWRNGVALDTMVRDMQVTINDCQENEPPTIETIDEICVIAGDLLEFDVVANDPDQGQLVKLIARGGPFTVMPSPAQFSGNEIFEPIPVGKTFSWQTTCEHISDQPYELIFRATDNYFGITGLSTIKRVKITVVGPPPENLIAEAIPGQIELFWDSPYSCENAADNFFLGFSVWRRVNSNDFGIDNCEPGLDGRGYTKIKSLTNEIQEDSYYFKDDNVDRGKTYCYRILANFARYTASGNTYLVIESLPSEEVCIQLNQDVPLLTHIDVQQTDPTNGEIFVQWIAPKHDELDTLNLPPPYRYQLKRSAGIGTEDFQDVPNANFNANTFWEIAQNTSYTDTDRSTIDEAYTYKIDFFVNGENEPIRSANIASSVFLTVGGADESTNLSWDYNAPWENNDFVIFKKQPDGSFILLDTVQTPSYTETELVNGREYCYYVETIGAYSVEGVPAPLKNKSQIACGTPLDTMPPCPPVLTVSNLCNQNIDCNNAPLDNYLSWTNPNNACPETDDALSYNVYFADREGNPFTLISSTDNIEDTLFTHSPERGIAGCYAVTAIDSFANESLYSNIVCVDNCPNYELPNTFTPNDDGQNDTFHPYPYCFIESIDFTVFNRWGQKVFATTNLDIEWTGKNDVGETLVAGTYWYTCTVTEQRVNETGANVIKLSGYIELLRE